MNEKELLLEEFKNFFYEMGEDWQLWDEEKEKEPYPILRIFDAMRNFYETNANKPLTTFKMK